MEDAAALEAEDEDDPSNLQLSWEMLELAKMVLLDQLEGEASKSLSEENKTILEKRLFETFLILGEVSLENENYPQAVEDLTMCLDKQQVSPPCTYFLPRNRYLSQMDKFKRLILPLALHAKFSLKKRI